MYRLLLGLSRVLQDSRADRYRPFCHTGSAGLQIRDGKKIPPPTPEGHEGRLFPPEQLSFKVPEQGTANGKCLQCDSSFTRRPDMATEALWRHLGAGQNHSQLLPLGRRPYERPQSSSGRQSAARLVSGCRYLRIAEYQLSELDDEVKKYKFTRTPRKRMWRRRSGGCCSSTGCSNAVATVAKSV